VDQRGQGTVEWVGTIAVVALLVAALVALGVRVPGTALARAVASRILCAASLADGCGDEPVLIATYGDEIGRLVRRHMPNLLLERGSRALPVDFRRCRAVACGDGTPRGLVHRTDRGQHVTAFVHVVDCRDGVASDVPTGASATAGEERERVGEGGAEAGSVRVAGAAAGRVTIGAAAGQTTKAGAAAGPPDCSGSRAGHLYIQYWTYYANSATLRGVPIAEDEGFHQDDWEGVQIRIGRDDRVDERASSHDGYNYAQSIANAGSDAGIDLVREAAEAIGARPRDGWGPETGLLLVSGGSHAGNAAGDRGDTDRIVPGRRVHLVPLEPIAAAEGDYYRFAISPPWRKRVWRDPEATDTS
jgi:hypothetical protein